MRPRNPFSKRKKNAEAEAEASEEALAEVARQEAKEEEFARSIQREARRRAKKEEEEAKRLRQEAEKMAKKAESRRKQQADLARHQERVLSLAEELGFDPERPVLEIPPIPEGMEEVEQISIVDGLSFVRILYDSSENEYVYDVVEPLLTPTDLETFSFLRDTLVRTMDGRDKEEGQRWESYLALAVEQAVADHDVLVDHVSLERIQYYLVRDFLGFGPVDVLMRDSMIEDISCDGPGIPIYLFHRKYESIRTSIVFKDDLELDSFVIRLAQQSGKHISIAHPLLDATLPDGSRLQATLSQEVTTRGSSFTVRKFRAEPLTPIDLVYLGTISLELAAYFWFLMEQGASLIMAGGTASGKTTTLNAACQFIPPEKKIVSIEDTREINLQHENWIAGLTRAGFGHGSEGKATGAVDMYDLLGAALRQRPEYLLVGEVRGKEALTLFQAMATGHAVYSTMHADSVPSAVYRLENEPINVPRMMLQTMDVIAIQGQVRIHDKLARRVMDITEIAGFDADTGDLLTNNVFLWDPETDTHEFLGKSHILEERMRRNNMTEAQLNDEWADRIKVLKYLTDHDVRDFEEVARYVQRYYRDKPALMQMLSGPPRRGPRGGGKPMTAEEKVPGHVSKPTPATRKNSKRPPVRSVKKETNNKAEGEPVIVAAKRKKEES